MPAVAIPVIAIAVSTASLGYGIYSGERARAAQQKAVDQAQRNAQSQQDLQTQQFQQQQQQQQQQLAQQKATEAQTVADTKAAQQQALANEQAAIGTNTNTLTNSINQQQKQSLIDQSPIIQERLNAMGLQNSGAYAAQLAKYQADLAAQAQSQIANYQIGAQGQLTQNTNAATADQVRLAEQNALLNINTGQQNMAQNFATQNINNQNNTAYQQYIANLQQAQAQSQQNSANAYTSLGGQLGGGLLNYYGAQSSSPATNQSAWKSEFAGDPYSPSMQAQYGMNPYADSMSSYQGVNPYTSYSPSLSYNPQPWNPALQALNSKSGPSGI